MELMNKWMNVIDYLGKYGEAPPIISTVDSMDGCDIWLFGVVSLGI